MHVPFNSILCPNSYQLWIDAAVAHVEDLLGRTRAIIRRFHPIHLVAASMAKTEKEGTLPDEDHLCMVVEVGVNCSAVDARGPWRRACT